MSRRKRERWVIKIGTSVLAPRGRGLSLPAFRRLARQVETLVQWRHEVVLVSSGAVAAGMEKLGLKTRPTAMTMLQAAAAVGQSHLIHCYERAFAPFKTRVAQVLLTWQDLDERRRSQNARRTFDRLLSLGVVPIVNENDSVAIEEMKVGDNDNLSALVAALIRADRLVLLSDVDGYYTRHPHRDKGARRVPIVERIGSRLIELADGSGREETVGGMRTKLQAARTAGRHGIPTIAANGTRPGIILRIARGESVGTLFLPTR